MPNRSLVAAGALLGLVVTACGSTPPTFICCFDVNGSQSYWQCPNQTAYAACCGTTNGCLSGDPAASGCTDDANPNDCP